MMMQQQQGVPGLTGNSGDGAAPTADTREPGGGAGGGGGGGSGGSGGVNEEEKGRSEESERNSGGSRWPRQETIALLKIRSDMDVAFRDSSLKGPLWEEVSRKLSELGYHRSAKKCKEKFENVYKYHKRTKDGRTTKPDGKTYRFFEQLEALDTHPSISLMSSSPMKVVPQAPAITSAMLGNNNINSPPIVTQVTVSSTPSPITTVYPNNSNSIVHPINLSVSQSPVVTTVPTIQARGIAGAAAAVGAAAAPAYNNPNMCGSLLSNSSSSTSSDDEPERYGRRKRKWEDFFGRLMAEVIQKQDELQKKFLDTLEKRERERMMREEAWRAQEMAKMNREHDLLVQERSMAAAKDAAVIAFLQKITEQQNPQNPIIPPPQLQQLQVQRQENPSPSPSPAPTPVSQPQQPPPPAVVPIPLSSVPAPASIPAQTPSKNPELTSQLTNYNVNDNFLSPSPSRWPKAEVQALIKLRTTLDTKYLESGPKGPLWEEISSAMRKMGYNRNAKRCKEKWENINKYYKKVKESNKKRPEDAKTCPYFHQLEALYKEKANTFNPGFGTKPPENPMVPLMVQPEQQWPLPQPDHHQPPPQQQQHRQDQDSAMEDVDSENMDQNNGEYEDEDEDEDDDDGAGYEIVTNNNKQPSSVPTSE